MALGKASRNLELINKPSINTINDLNQDNLERRGSDLYCEEQLDLLEYLPEFFIWLNEQIKLGNHQFILGQIQNDSDEPKNNPHKRLIFLLVELLEQYSDYSGVSVFTIHAALKQTLSISYCYTIERDNQIIEVTPCLYPLYYNLCYDVY
ncbi:hypothetical protein ACQUW5_09695 [Legionella sp. CNM-1927-20]|uniref:hypothetical protein n=1 Tax=Legionella sp. CNM-1927-20 TaxID=3422221 RepID=UPI00403A9F2B